MVALTQELNKNTFDFWVGDWEVSWETPDGKIAKGMNRITKILGDKVIQEDFKDESKTFQGRSLSIYDARTTQWKQTWVDTDGSHFNFIGAMENGQPIFRTNMIEKDGQKIIYKMIFKDITSSNFFWEWRKTEDNGTTWKTLWKIKYSRT